MNIDPNEWAQKTADLVRRTVSNLVAPLEQRLKAIEDRPIPKDGKDGVPGEQGPAGERGADGSDGKDGAPGEQGPAGQPGANGVAGESGRPPTLEEIAAAVASHLEANPPGPGERGAPGQDGAPGEKGLDGAPGRPPTPEEIAAAVEAHLKSNPPAAGQTGPAGERGEKGVDGRDGRDGLPGGAGANGKDGRDGFNLTDFEMSLAEDGRTVVLKFASGEVSIERRVKLATILDRGVYKAATEYEAGDAVSFGGNMWIAQVSTTDKPGESKSWRLAVKKGRDGQDGTAGPRGPVGEKGLNGRDLTRMLPDGTKY